MNHGANFAAVSGAGGYSWLHSIGLVNGQRDSDFKLEGVPLVTVSPEPASGFEDGFDGSSLKILTGPHAFDGLLSSLRQAWQYQERREGQMVALPLPTKWWHIFPEI